MKIFNKLQIKNKWQIIKIILRTICKKSKVKVVLFTNCKFYKIAEERFRSKNILLNFKTKK